MGIAAIGESIGGSSPYQQTGVDRNGGPRLAVFNAGNPDSSVETIRLTPDHAARVCFPRRGSGTPHTPISDDAFACSLTDVNVLPLPTGVALATLFQFLLCGEESASHAFADSLAESLTDEDRVALGNIAAEEATHAHWIAQWNARLPAPEVTFDVRISRAFFRRLLTRDRALHFARIAALDTEVCRLLSQILRGKRLAPYDNLRAALRRLRSDEVNHVRVARTLAQRLGMQREDMVATHIDIRQRLARLLAPAQSALALLSVINDARSADA